jgi:DNA-binding MurR/RpiR family transcriptional regulator
LTHAAEKLEAKQETALAALLAHPTVAEAAKAAKVSQATLWRYMRDEKFSARYAEARQDVTKHLIMRLTSDSTKAARVLLEVAEDTSAPANARVSAARTIIEQALRGAELRDLMERIEALETMQKGKP